MSKTEYFAIEMFTNKKQSWCRGVSSPQQICKIESFAIIVKGQKSLITFAKLSILDVCMSSGNTFLP